MSEILDIKLFDNELKTCPFCGNYPGFHTVKLESSGNTVYIYYQFGCQKCGVYAPKPKDRTTYYGCVTVTLNKLGKIWVGIDDRNKDIESWNHRV